MPDAETLDRYPRPIASADLDNAAIGRATRWPAKNEAPAEENPGGGTIFRIALLVAPAC